MIDSRLDSTCFGHKASDKERNQWLQWGQCLSTLETTTGGAEYVEVMNKHRCGVYPESASRFEYQISRSWLRRYALDDVDTVTGRLPDIVDKLTSNTYPLCVVTDAVPDRKNKNQQRAGVHADWQWIVGQFRELAGQPSVPLGAIERGQMELPRAYSMIRGFVLHAAAKLGMVCESVTDACEVLLKLDEQSDQPSSEWSRRWKEKAIREGTYQDLMSFEFGKLAKVPVRADNKEVPHDGF